MKTSARRACAIWVRRSGRRLLDLDSMHRVIAGCETMFFYSMSFRMPICVRNGKCLRRWRKHHGVREFLNMSQMKLIQMSITKNHREPAAKAALARRAGANWSVCPVVHVRPTVFPKAAS